MCHELVIKQYVYEAESWGRMLAFFLRENVSFKTRLAEIVNYNLNPDDLEIAEKFQEEFISQDRIISFLSDELHQQSKLLERDLYEDGELFKEVMRNQKKLRRDLKKAEQLFGKVKEDFDGYLNDNFSFSGVQL